MRVCAFANPLNRVLKQALIGLQVPQKEKFHEYSIFWLNYPVRCAVHPANTTNQHSSSPFRRGFFHLYDAWLARGKSSYTDFRAWLDTHVEKNEWLVVDAKEQQEIQAIDGTVLGELACVHEACFSFFRFKPFSLTVHRAGTMNALQAILLDENGHPWPVIPTKEDVDKVENRIRVSVTNIA